ncbi:peptidase A24A prepilin type IV [Thermincola ferriacetica]|uniref:Peptidase A24A prepilin type IV n=2 Tax=Thermincola TaxID=278993 RepID=D5XAR8_THEPJ|nr:MULTISPECIES: prepilin peptidase [Thermincola]ADG83272.1 peptidase A24A prepilin type IV [Thermincola potens JR]KNZ68806.1 peptidase A24A prepilin type IV [Thermincola ferriacetica]
MVTVCFIGKSLILIIILGLALYYDIREQKIKNFITLPAAVLGLATNLMEGGLTGLLFSIKGWLVPVAVLMVLYRINVMGAGDIKLFAAIGAVMGLPFTAYSFVFSVYTGGVIALVILLKKRVFIRRMQDVCNYFKYIFLTGRLAKYSGDDDKSSKFIFSTAIVPGTMIQYIITLLQFKGIILFN